MAWTTPRTWVAGETPTAAIMNAHIRDNLNYLYTPPGCRVRHDANQNTTTAVVLALALNTERYDTDTMHDTVTANSRITFTTAGRYIVIGNWEMAANATGARTAGIRTGGSVYVAETEQPEVSAVLIAMCVATIYSFAAADYVELTALQNSGSTLAVNASASYSPEFMAHWLGA